MVLTPPLTHIMQPTTDHIMERRTSSSAAASSSERQKREQQELQDKRRSAWGWLYDLPDTAIKIVASKWKQEGEGPLFDEELAEWLMERCGFFPRCWNLDIHLYPLLRKRPNLAQLLVRQESMQRSDREGVRSLTQAFEDCQMDCVKGLLAAGVDVNAQYNNQATPLHASAFSGHLDCLKLLLEVPGVEVNAKNLNNCAPLHYVVMRGHTDCLKLLLEVPGVELNAKDKKGLTPLHFAFGLDTLRFGHTDCVKVLLETPGVEVNEKTQYEETPLDWAKEEGQSEIVKLLLEHGAIDHRHD